MHVYLFIYSRVEWFSFSSLLSKAPLLYCVNTENILYNRFTGEAYGI